MARKKYHESKRGREDSGMIKEDHSSMANLPQNVIMKKYAKFPYGLHEYLDDTAGGIDEQIYDDIHKMKKDLSKTKY